MARYGEALRNRLVARLFQPESANAGLVAKEIGVSVQTLEPWREDAPSRM
jgi:transposase-like protein